MPHPILKKEGPGVQPGNASEIFVQFGHMILSLIQHNVSSNLGTTAVNLAQFFIDFYYDVNGVGQRLSNSDTHHLKRNSNIDTETVKEL